MGPLQQVLLLALCLLVSLPLWGILLHRRRNISGPSRVKAPDHYTFEPSGVKAPVHEVNDSLDRLGKQLDVPTTQILFFHGFPLEDFSNVHLSTWDNGDGFLWPQAWLVEKFPGAQIFFVKYGAALRNSKVFTMNNIAENLISDLLQANIGQVRDCPVVMVGHCVGGLVMKALCCKAHELHSSDTFMNDRAKKLQAFLERVSGIFYYSTPHHGFREIPEGLRSSDNALFTYLQVLSTNTAVLNSNFSKLCKRYRKWKIEGVGESLPAKLGVFKNILVVPEASARDGVQVFNVLKEEDHFSVCKPKTITSGGFYHLTGFLTEIEEEEIKLREETRHQNIEIELKVGIRPENFQTISKAVVGIQIPLQAVIEKLKAISTLGLTGMGGSGKTTLAKAVFNELGCNFEYTCFVSDVKLIKGTSVETVKEEIWKHVYCNGYKVGGEMRWSLLQGKRLLLVLDDIAGVRDTTVLSDIADGPSLDSRFIVTSRNDDLFEFFYKVPRLDETNHDTELFMSYAFPNNETPSPQLRCLTEEIVKKCEGLPLTLEVLGQWLRKTKDVEFWKQTLKAFDEAELVTSFNERLWVKLRLSIDGLQKNEKQMFLDASAFFGNNLWTLREAKEAWKVAYNGVSEVFWKTLVDRSLVYDVDDHDYVKVHEQLRSLGRKIADESKAYVDIRTLEDFELLQSANELEKKSICALRIKVDRPYGEGNHLRQSSLDDQDSEQVNFEDEKNHTTSFSLQELKELKYLDVDYHGEIDGAAEAILFPRKLIVLRCVGVNTLSLAHQRRLVVLTMSGVKSLPNDIGQLSALRMFTLCDCENLRTLPNSFSDLSALERLMFQNCALETLPESFGELSALKSLQFDDCYSLESLSESFGLLGALADLKFEMCNKLESLPNTFGHLSALSRLELKGCSSLESLPESFGNLSALTYLKFKHCYLLRSLPESFGLLGALVDLKFEDCDSLESLPNTFGHLYSLSRLKFASCSSLKSLPESFVKLSTLKYLWFENCGSESLPESVELLGALVDLKMFGRDLLECLPEILVSLREWKKATGNFAESAQIGEGGFGKVYNGKLIDGTRVAIKRSKREGSAKDKEQFLNEVRILCQVNHRNLVKLLGCCMENKVALLVFEFVSNGTLEEHLQRKIGVAKPLSWKQRPNIAVQTADALNYLHSTGSFPIYHRDVKSANILLTKDLNAKVADFGISKLAHVESSGVSTIAVQGTMGYIDPEYYTSYQYTGKSDVYSFGVVLLELISAKPAVDFKRGEDEKSLVNFATPLVKSGDLQRFLDSSLIETYKDPILRKSILNVGRLAMRCLDMRSGARPTMNEVTVELQSLYLELYGTFKQLGTVL